MLGEKPSIAIAMGGFSISRHLYLCLRNHKNFQNIWEFFFFIFGL